MAAIHITAGIILLLVLGTYLIQAVLLALMLALWLLRTIIVPAGVILVWLIMLPFGRDLRDAGSRAA